MEAAPGDFELRLDYASQFFRRSLVWRRRGRRRGTQEIDGVLATLKLHVRFDYTEPSAGWKRRVLDAGKKCISSRVGKTT